MKIVDVKADSDLSHLPELELRTCKIHYEGYLPQPDAQIAVAVINKYLVRRHPVAALDFSAAEVDALPLEERAAAADFREKHKGRSPFDVFGELVAAGEIDENY